MDLYQSYIHKSKYARYIPELNRREHWDETVSRYIDFIENSLLEKQKYTFSKELKEELKSAIVNLEIMPSMRALMTAGKALERDNTAGYNCSYLPVDDPKAFDECMHILMNGTGVGFSVERQYINKLPEIPDQLYNADTVIVVKDSKEGWSKALRMLIALLYSGEIAKWDLSKLRPAGAPLKTFGGRSSGPAPLDDLFKFVVNVFKNATGRKLTSLECHDVMCKIAETIVVGGVRRSALISLSNLSDDRMRNAKIGSWWESNVQRALSNNSAVYTEKPDISTFMEEWLSLYQSKSGERGIFNRDAARRVAEKNGRRDPDHEWGCNPCFSGETIVAVADGRNGVSIKELAEIGGYFPVYSAKESYYSNQFGKTDKFNKWKTEIKNARAFKTGSRKIITIKLSNGDTFNCTPEHRLALNSGGYVEANKSLNCVLEKIYTTNEKYRTINSYTDGHSRQYRMLWEYHNGTLLEGYHIDHINNTIGDFIENLQLLTKDEHNNKSSTEKLGNNNPVFKIKDTDMWKHNMSASVSFNKNPNFSGVSDEEIIEAGRQLISMNYKINIKNLRTINDKIPQHFSKNRFGGSIKNLIDICENKTKYIPPSVNYKITKSQMRNLAEPLTVVEVIDNNITEDVYDLTVDDNHNFYIITSGSDNFNLSEGVLVHNCSEIILRPYQFCNLTEVIVRSDDTEQSLLRKVYLATILGTFQSTLTNFPYLRKIWNKNTEEERLLGVSFTGIYDCKLINDYTDQNLPHRLEAFREMAVVTNKKFAKDIGVPQSAAITCTKPSGTISQLTDSASGIHPRHDPYYFRRVRSDNKDPLNKFLINAGILNEPDVTKPDSTTIFTFPKKAPEGALVRSDISALDHLNLWLVYQRHWCEHKPSVTISVKENEWMAVGAWVYENFDEVSGISFLPYDGGSYRQAPYETITKEQYEELLTKTPTVIDWNTLVEFEDNVEGVQTLSCTAGNCDI